MSKKEVIKGIYYYLDKVTGKIDYIGKDSNISKNTRHNAHKCASYYDDQPFNRILQNNPNRYEYGVFCKGPFTDEELIELENIYKKGYSPRFDFEYRSHGGLTESHKQKISESKKGHTHKKSTRELMSKNHYDCSGDKNPRFLKHLPSNRELYVELKRGASIKELSLKYNCGTATISRRLKKYKDTIKHLPQLTTHGHKKDGTIMYCIRWKGESIKYSIYKSELIKWFEETYGEKVITF